MCSRTSDGSAFVEPRRCEAYGLLLPISGDDDCDPRGELGIEVEEARKSIAKGALRLFLLKLQINEVS